MTSQMMASSPHGGYVLALTGFAYLSRSSGQAEDMASTKSSNGEEAAADQCARKRRKLGSAICTCFSSSSSSRTQVELLHRPFSEECIKDQIRDDFPSLPLFDLCESESSARTKNGDGDGDGYGDGDDFQSLPLFDRRKSESSARTKNGGGGGGGGGDGYGYGYGCLRHGVSEFYHHLPHDLVISNIVAFRLPLLDLIRARAVCKSWRDSIFSLSFAESFAANADFARPRLLVEHSSPSGPCLAAFDSSSKRWTVVPTPPFRRLVAASMGLFCFITGTERPPSLVVGNPLTDKWKHLPAIPLCVPAHGPILVAMVANCKEASYKVSVLFGMWDDDATDAYLPFMYDSVSDKWQERKSISARLSFATSRSVVKTPDILLSVDSNAGNVLSYDMTSNVGHMIQLENSPTLINEQDPKTNLWRRLPQIAVCDGVLYLVARCVGQKAPECKLGQLPIVQHSPVGVWTMRENSEKWDFITSIPFDLLEMIVRGSDGTDFIVASNGHNELFFVLKGSLHMLALNPSSQTWTLLPGCPTDYNLYPLHQSVFVEPLVWLPVL